MTLQKTIDLIQEVVDNSVLQDGGTVHLYISPPNLAALDNHTDITDVVFLQPEGDKEWLLCKDDGKAGAHFENATLFSEKLYGL